MSTQTEISHVLHQPAWAAARASRFKQRFAAVLTDIARGAIAREEERRLPFAELEQLKDAGFTRATLPEELGGGGASLSEGLELLSHLAQHEPNLAQVLRSHFALIERQILAPPSSARDRVLARIASGAVYGNASHERSSAQVGSLETRVRAHGDGYVLSGTKYYSTGTLYADWVSVSAVDEEREFVGVAVDTRSPGVTRADDWNGFGQRLTGSGTTVFDEVRVPAHDVTHRTGSAPGHGGAYVQLVLLATLNGIGRAIVSDAIEFVTRRTRVYSNGSGATAASDPIVLETIGELSALSYQADAALQSAVAALQDSHDLQGADADPRTIDDAVARGDIATAHAQIVVVTAVLDAATKLFDIGGASATDRSRGLDRHWRNARTIATHNPHRNKAKAIGDLLVNGTPLSNSWQTGEAAG